MTITFGAQLRHWRGLRRLSQLDLGLEAGVSARHLSFLESGRASPSRAMALHLAEALDVPRDARNALLAAAGFAPAFAARPSDHVEVAAAAEAMAWMVDRHAPYPGFVIDRHWRLVRLNPPAAALLAGVGLAAGDSLLEAFLSAGPLREALVNWAEVGRSMLARLRTEAAHFGADPVLDGAVRALAADPALAEGGDRPPPALIPVRYALGGRELSLFSVIAQFGATEDIALADLRIELLFPADAESRAWFGG